MKPHRLAEYFPLLEGEEFEQLKQDIKENELLEPIVVYDGQILDGVNRYNACLELGVMPDTREFNGGDPLSYVISANVRRRHLTESQKALLALDLLPEYEREARKRQSTSKTGKTGGQPLLNDFEKGEAANKVAKGFGISGRLVHQAKRAQREAPDRISDIKAGKTTLFAVDTEIKELKARERARARVKETNKKERQENPHEVKEYLDALKEFDMAIQTAIRVAKYGKFSPEAKKYVIRRHSQIRNYLLGFDDLLERLE